VPEAIVAPWRVAVFQGDATGWQEAPELFCTTEPPTDSEEEPPPESLPSDEAAPLLERILPGVPPPTAGPASSGRAATPHNQASLRRSRVSGYAPPTPSKQAISRMVSFVEKRTGLTVPELAVSRGFTEMSLRKAFGAFDVDGDGSVTVEELTQILTRDSRASTGTAPMSVEDAKELIAAFDTDGDGTLSWEEFTKAFTVG